MQHVYVSPMFRCEIKLSINSGSPLELWKQTKARISFSIQASCYYEDMAEKGSWDCLETFKNFVAPH